MNGNRLRELREKLGLTQTDLAERAQTSQSTIAHYERGTRSPDALVVLHLAHFFGVSVEYLLGISDNPARATALPPGWEKVISDAMENGYTPEEVARALYLLRAFKEGEGRG